MSESAPLGSWRCRQQPAVGCGWQAGAAPRLLGQDPRPFVWTRNADEILDTIAAYCQRINDSGN